MNYNEAAFERSFGVSAQLPASDLPEIVFAGRSNVGKSSLINRVFSRKGLARVSSQPGKTATVNFFTCGGIRFVDLPGYGYARVSHGEKLRWAELIEGYFAGNRDIRMVFALMDARHAPSADDLQMANFLIENELPFAVVLTKTDKLTPKELADRLTAFRAELPCGDQLTLLPVSASDGSGIAELRGVIAEVEADAAEEAADAEKPAP